MSVRQCQAEVDWREFVDWQLYKSLTGPLDPRVRGDWQAATVALASCQNGKAKLTDFVLKWHNPKPDKVSMGKALIQQFKGLGAKVVKVVRGKE